MDRVKKVYKKIKKIRSSSSLENEHTEGAEEVQSTTKQDETILIVETSYSMEIVRRYDSEARYKTVEDIMNDIEETLGFPKSIQLIFHCVEPMDDCHFNGGQKLLRKQHQIEELKNAWGKILIFTLMLRGTHDTEVVNLASEKYFMDWGYPRYNVFTMGGEVLVEGMHHSLLTTANDVKQFFSYSTPSSSIVLVLRSRQGRIIRDFPLNDYQMLADLYVYRGIFNQTLNFYMMVKRKWRRTVEKKCNINVQGGEEADDGDFALAEVYCSVMYTTISTISIVSPYTRVRRHYEHYEQREESVDVNKHELLKLSAEEIGIYSVDQLKIHLAQELGIPIDQQVLHVGDRYLEPGLSLLQHFHEHQEGLEVTLTALPTEDEQLTKTCRDLHIETVDFIQIVNKNIEVLTQVGFGFSTTVHNLTQAIQTKFGIPHYLQVLFYNRQKIEPSRRVMGFMLSRRGSIFRRLCLELVVISPPEREEDSDLILEGVSKHSLSMLCDVHLRHGTNKESFEILPLNLLLPDVGVQRLKEYLFEKYELAVESQFLFHDGRILDDESYCLEDLSLRVAKVVVDLQFRGGATDAIRKFSDNVSGGGLVLEKVCIRMLTGVEFDISLVQKDIWCVNALKMYLEKHLEIPVECQRIFCNKSELKNGDEKLVKLFLLNADFSVSHLSFDLVQDSRYVL